MIVKDELSRALAGRLVAGLTLTKSWVVEISEYKPKRSLSQNALMWKWIHEIVKAISDRTGHDADELHEFFKQKFLTPKVVEIEGQTVNIYSTKNLSKGDMSDYMDRIQAWSATQLGVYLTLPEELHKR